MAKIYVITSGKGGTGKSTTAVNLGSAFNKFGEETVIVDANLTTPNLGIYFGAPIVPLTLNHVLQGKADVEDAIYEHESGLKLIPSSISLKDMKKLKYDKIHDVSKKLKKSFDSIIFDSAAGLGDEAKIAIEAGDEIIVVTNPNILSVTDALKAIKFSEELGKFVKGAIITRVKNEKIEMSLESIKEMLEVPILGIVPEDYAVSESLVRKNSVVHTRPWSKSARAYMNIAARILEKELPKESLYARLMARVGLR